MRDYEIPEQQWISYFDGFSREHAGWPVTIEVLTAETGPQRVATDLALQGISFDSSGTRPCTIQVGAGDDTSANMSHVIDLPLHIREVKDDDNGDVTIQIEPARGAMTLIHLHQPVQ